MIPDEQLKKAALEADHILMAAVPEAESCDHEFSPAFEGKMEKLIHRRKHPVMSHPVFRAAAAFFVLVLLSGLVLLAVPDAKASFNGLFFEEKDGVYYYVLTDYVDADDLRTYHLGWIPEGYTVKEETHSNSYGRIRYRNQEKAVIVFSYRIQREGDDTQLGHSLQNLEHQWKEITINGRGADLFELYYSNGEVGYYINWMNEEQSILFTIECAQMSEAVKLAENVIAKEKEE